MGCAGLGCSLLGRGQLAAHLACLVSCQLARFGNEMWKKTVQREEKNELRLDDNKQASLSTAYGTWHTLQSAEDALKEELVYII